MSKRRSECVIFERTIIVRDEWGWVDVDRPELAKLTLHPLHLLYNRSIHHFTRPSSLLHSSMKPQPSFWDEVEACVSLKERWDLHRSSRHPQPTTCYPWPDHQQPSTDTSTTRWQLFFASLQVRPDQHAFTKDLAVQVLNFAIEGHTDGIWQCVPSMQHACVFARLIRLICPAQ